MSPIIELPVCARIPTPYGEFKLCVFQDQRDQKEHMALVRGDVSGQENVLTRVHSECFTGDVLGSLRCDCGEQLQQAISMIASHGRGILIYLRQEGRGIGLMDKLRAYNLQDEGYDTVDANLALGHQADERDYTVAAEILEILEVTSIEIITNNPTKIAALASLGVRVTDRWALIASVNPENIGYLQTKVSKMKHLLDLDLDERPDGSQP